MSTKTFTVPNISCNHCVATVEKELKSLNGVKFAKADLTSKNVTVEWDTPATWDEIKKHLAEIDYPAQD